MIVVVGRLSSMIMLIVFTTLTIITLTGLNFASAQGQANDTTTTTLTPEQRDAICNPNNSLSNLNLVNTTESKICGIPKTLKPSSNTTTTEEATNTTATIGTETPSASSQSTSIAPSNTSSSLTPSNHSPSSLYEQGYAKGVADSKLVQVTNPPTGTKMRPDDVDCDSNIDPLASNQDYCSGYQHGYADTFNNALTRK